MIGAGPAGIAAVGRLLDHGVAAERIAWVDPAFAAGDIGQKWRSVSSNTHVALFLEYFNGSKSFRFSQAPPMPLKEVDPQETCALGLVAEPLVWITEHLHEQVDAFTGTATALTLQDRQWRIQTEQRDISSKHVILAVGAEPKKLSHPDLDAIAVEVALDPEKLAQEPLAGATVAVFGSSHSSMIVLPNLLRHPVERVINFYRSPLKYAVYLDDWILFDDTGLKGQAAAWARENIDGVLPDRLERCWVSSPEFAEKLAQCDRVVYTVGFERRKLPETPQWGRLDYDRTNGILAPGLFGVGIAFPQYAEDPYGHGQFRVGLKKFMDYLDAVLPLWLRYSP
ncbi:pyridine nucleotide-disulfide oxidoreductase [Mycobacterium sp. 852002-40037_SCH5390672]|uniref:pyridine nucleotide-disulfide oxidoreductase n=1 Tax=Mycobacterium sp. 852002-40037_SCH5390672 TaxID=1834089 RepID=UPI0008052CE0|nr:pyridine nucleotide-disulfide oxidoreductase [Mycobacterium sp. 852002-40037_SCH5390672]OBB99261.1 pyridine nucleotide-disulfide oxidoreductase [Mycobacterium sp. 852002-40037_SCH5390672]